MKKNNKKILTAVATLGGSVALLVGGAFAWFSATTDATTGGNIVIGDMSVTATLQVYNPGAEGANKWETANGVNISDMMPGHTRFYALDIEPSASGNLSMTVTAAGITQNGTVASGALVIDKMVLNIDTVTTIPETPTATGSPDVDTDPNNAAVPGSIGTQTENLTKDIVVSLDYSAHVYVLMEFYFDGSAGNDYQGLSLTLGNIRIDLEQDHSVVII